MHGFVANQESNIITRAMLAQLTLRSRFNATETVSHVPHVYRPDLSPVELVRPDDWFHQEKYITGIEIQATFPNLTIDENILESSLS